MDSLKKAPIDEGTLNVLIKNIADGEAVLIIGQEIIPGGWCEKLNLYLDNKMKGEYYYYPKDELFLFPNIKDQITARGHVVDFFNKFEKNDEIYKRIIELPFKLMISFNPDKYILDIFNSYYQIKEETKLQFDFFSIKFPKQRKKYQIDTPTINKPLLYNLCGSIEEKDSIILEYKDLFDLIKLISDYENKVPEQVRYELCSIPTYILLGFKFDIWYNQFLLKTLQNAEEKLSYAVNTSMIDYKGALDYFSKLFGSLYIELDTDSFIKLHERFKSEYDEKIRKINPLNTLQDVIINLINKDDYDNIFKKLDDVILSSSGDYQMLIHIKHQYDTYKEHKKNKSAISTDLDKLIANIRNAIIELSKNHSAI